MALTDKSFRKATINKSQLIWPWPTLLCFILYMMQRSTKPMSRRIEKPSYATWNHSTDRHEVEEPSEE